MSQTSRRMFLYGGGALLLGGGTLYHYLSQSSSQPKPREIARLNQHAPDFSIPDIDGRVAKLSEYRGKPVVINFFELWCPPCVREIPSIDEFARAYGDEFPVIGITADNVGKTAEVFRAKGIGYRTLIDKSEKILDSYGIAWIPTTFIVDENGVLRYKITEPTNFMDENGPVIKGLESIVGKSLQRKIHT